MEDVQQTIDYGKVVDIAIGLLDGSETQTRVGLRDEAVNDYRNVLLDGGELPPITVYHTPDGRLLVSGGFHRIEAHKRAGRSSIKAVVHPGDQWAAVQAGLRDNRQHRGERLSSADKRHAAGIVLNMHPELSDAVLAALVGCSDRSIAKYRSKTGPKISGVETRVGIDSKTYPVAKRATAETRPEPERAVSRPDVPPSGQPIETPQGVVVETAAQPTQQPPGLIGSSVDTPEAVPKLEPCRGAGKAARVVQGQPASKSTAEQLIVCRRPWAFLSNAVDGMKQSDPARHRRIRHHLDAISEELEAWSKQETETISRTT